MTNRSVSAAARLAACLLALVCLLSLPALPGARAFAESPEEPAAPVDLTAGGCGLTVYPVSSYADFAEDLRDNAAITVDVYKVAEAAAIPGVDAYGYRFIPPFDDASVTTAAAAGMTLADGVNVPNAALSAAKWDELAQAAAAVVKNSTAEPAKLSAVKAKGAESVRVPASGTMDKGLYLVLAHTEETDYWDEEAAGGALTTKVESSGNKYRYLPLLVTLPHKSETLGNYRYDDDGPIVPDEPVTSAAEGAWIYDLTLYLKPESENRKADLIIKKTLRNYHVNSKALFVFRVDAAMPDAPDTSVYSAVFSVSLAADGSKATIARNIPIGAEVTVEETYFGASCKPSPGTKTVYTGRMSENGLVIGSEAPRKVLEFFNEGDGTNGGGGIENSFEYKEGEHWVIIAQNQDPGVDESELVSPGTP